MTVDRGTLPSGRSCVDAELGGERIAVSVHKANQGAEQSVLILFHGIGRRADAMLSAALALAQTTNTSLVAPLFTRERFPNWRYQRAGIVRAGKMQPPHCWTASLVDQLVDWSRLALDANEACYVLYGHSAGAQFLSRAVAYGTSDAARRVVVANASVYVCASFEEPVPYGFGAGLEAAQAEKKLQAYLRQPLTIYVGGNDITNKDLTQNAPAQRQGDHRLARAKNVYRRASRFAHAHDLEFNWQLVVADGIGHSSHDMLQAPCAIRALGLSSADKA